MIKTFCDCCGEEIIGTNKIPVETDGCCTRLEAEVKSRDRKSILNVKIMTGKNKSWNNGHFCKYCVIDAIYRLDDRPVEERSAV